MTASRYFFTSLLVTSLYAATQTVTTNADSGAGSLRAAILAAAANDTIECMMIAGQTINLASSLPTVNKNLTIQTSGGSAVLINGQTLYQILPIASGTISITNFTLENGISKGGAGGSGFGGGGGGAGGGGALYIANGANVTLTSVGFFTNQAVGGAGGVGNSGLACGGGGGGFAGGAGGTADSTTSGGGGGGNSGGGNGGGTGSLPGVAATANTFSGGGGGAGSTATGGAGGSAFAGAGGTSSANGGGGGAGAGAVGGNSGAGGGTGGNGIDTGNTFGGGGGGGGASAKNGGNGTGTGGGGGGGAGGSTTGGQGGAIGGGGGGSSAAGGGTVSKGGLGGGGGGTGSMGGGTSVFGGGTGGTGAGSGGGGGAGLGGAIFVENGGLLTFASSISLSGNGNSVTVGAGGAGTVPGTAGQNLGPDLFLSSGSTLTFNNTMTVSSAIASDQGAGGGTGGGVTVAAGTGTVTLSGVNTYSGTVTINSGTLNVTTDNGFGATANPIAFGGAATLQAGGSFTSARNVTLTGIDTFDTQTNSVTFATGVIGGAGSLTKIGTGTLTLQGVNTYMGGTTINAGVLNALADTALGNAAGTVTIGAGTLQAGANYTSSSRTITLTGSASFDTQSNNVALSGQINGTTGSFTKLGSGMLTLSGNNNYMGGTSISAGTLNAAADTALGNVAGGITIANGATLQAGVGFTTSTRSINLTGNGTIDTQTTNVALSGTISGAGSLIKGGSAGTGTLTLTGTNTYSGGTTINIGTLNISSDAALGNSSGSVTMGSATFQTGGSFSSARAFQFSGGSSIFDTQIAANTLTLSGKLSGSGSLTKINPGTLILSGSSTFSGGITISGGTIQGNASSLTGNITNNGNLVFNQTTAGTYSSSIGGTGTLSLQGNSTITFSGNSSGFIGPITVNSGTTLKVNGTLGGSLLTIASGATLRGIGTVPSVNNSGHLAPGNSIGTLTINGNLTETGSPTFNVEISPTSSDLVIVNGTATLGGTVVLTLDSGFYGVQPSYTILTANSISGSFSGISSPDPTFSPFLSYTGTKVILSVNVQQPFINFKGANENIQSVANNINALGAAGSLTSDTCLFNALNSLTGSSTSAINTALNQLHPAQFSAFSEWQTEVGGQMLSQFHHRLSPTCFCDKDWSIWIEPFGNWLREKNTNDEFGFEVITKGISGGVDRQLLEHWYVGFGAVLDSADLTWASGRGSSDIKSWHVGLYTDYSIPCFYVGWNFLIGMDHLASERHIEFGTVNENAFSQHYALDFMSQLSTAVLFGPSYCVTFPYVNLDYLYLDQREVTEKNACGLDLQVQANSSSTLRSEIGMGLQVQDHNFDRTICVNPQVSIGYAIDWPLHRDLYVSKFAGESIPFKVKGWNKTWNLFNVHFGLGLSYRCLTVFGEYMFELAPYHSTALVDQRGNIRLELNW